MTPMALSDDERDELRATARRLLDQRSSPERVRAAVETEAGHDEGLWEQLVELGWTSLHHDERFGGAGAGYADLAVVLQELGGAVTPSPFLASAVLAAGALARADGSAVADEHAAALAAGTARGAVALAATDGSYDLGRATVTWRPAGAGGLRLDGAAGFVADADGADVLVVTARGEGGEAAAVLVDPSAPGVCVEVVPTVDVTRRLCTVSIDAVVVAEDHWLTEPGPAAAALHERVLALGVIATACDSAGVAARALERTVAYAKERLQFGRPIGSFQAVKHHCADMAVAVEASRAATLAAAATLDATDDPVEWATAAAVVSSYVGPVCSRACERALLVHGGIGFTWEHDAHLFLKRAKLDEVLFGTPAWHRRRLADAVFPTLVAR